MGSVPVWFFLGLADETGPWQTGRMVDWSALTEAERNDIENKVLAALNSIGVQSETTCWNKPAQLPHWQLIIQTPWCDKHSRGDVSRAKEQAIARAQVEAPINGIILKGHKKVWR